MKAYLRKYLCFIFLLVSFGGGYAANFYLLSGTAHLGEHEYLIDAELMKKPDAMIARVDFLVDSLQLDTASLVWTQFQFYKAEALKRNFLNWEAEALLTRMLSQIQLVDRPPSRFEAHTLMLYALVLEKCNLDQEASIRLVEALERDRQFYG